jgi:hypothetical protein
MSASPPRFSPLLRATPVGRAALFLIGPLLWLAALSGLGVIVSGTHVVGYGLLIAGGSFVIAIPALLLLRRRRVRREREGGAGHGG